MISNNITKGTTMDIQMNQICKVCGEPAAGFHFGAFTCEGCKSFFGRSYNNLSSISECKNNGECIINKKNRTSCKACRLKKCLMVGMSKSGSRYGRRSNWFKIHCLLQEQHHSQQQQPHQSPMGELNALQLGVRGRGSSQRTPPPPSQMPLTLMGVNHFPPPLLHLPRTREELMLLGLDEQHMNSASPSVSSPESHNSDSSVELNDARRLPLFPGFLPAGFMPPPSFLLTPGYHSAYSSLLQPATNNNNGLMANQNHHQSHAVEAYKRVYLEAVLQSQRSPRTPTPEQAEALRMPGSPDTVVAAPAASAAGPSTPVQDTPIDLSVRSTPVERGASPTDSEPSTRSARTERGAGSEADGEISDCDSEKSQKKSKAAPLDLTTKP